MEITFEQIQEALQTNEELAKKVSTSFLTPEAINGYLESEDGKKVLQPKLDSYFSKGLDTWKNNNLQKLIDEEVSRRNPAETPEQKALRELNQKMAKIESEKIKAEQIALGQAIASEKGLPTSLVPYFVGDNESDTRNKLNFLELEYKSTLEKQVEARLKSAGTVPNVPTEGSQGGQGTPTAKDFMSMSYSERVELYNKNPQLYMQIANG
jgi:hypothetical protein